MDTTALERRLQAIQKLLDCSFGSLWFVGEDVWVEKLPSWYVLRNDRIGHPGICLNNNENAVCLHAAMMMWHGSTPRSQKDERAIENGKRFVVHNFMNDDPKHRTMFGHFSAVAIDKTSIGSRTFVETDFDSEIPEKSKQSKMRMNKDKARKWKSVVVPNGTGRRLSDEEKANLRAFTRKFYAIG